MNLKYYNPEIHKASFILPEFARKVHFFWNAHMQFSNRFDLALLRMSFFFCFFFEQVLSSEAWHLNPCVSCIWRWDHRETVLSDTNSSLKIRPAEDGDPSNCFQCLGTTDNERWTLSELDKKKFIRCLCSVSFQSYILLVFIYYFQNTRLFNSYCWDRLITCLVLGQRSLTVV